METAGTDDVLWPVQSYGLFGVIGTSIVSLGITETQVAKRDRRRIAILFSNSGANPVRVIPDIGISADRGFLLSATSGTLFLSHRDFGALVSEGWLGLATIATSTLTIFEVTLSES